MGQALVTPEDEVFRALADPRRRAIIRLVARDELAAGEIARTFDVTRTAVSQHLTLLKSAHLLTERREGTKRFYRADADGLTALRRTLDEIWASSLDVGRRLVEQDRAARPQMSHRRCRHDRRTAIRWAGRRAAPTADPPAHDRRQRLRAHVRGLHGSAGGVVAVGAVLRGPGADS